MTRWAIWWRRSPPLRDPPARPDPRQRVHNAPLPGKAAGMEETSKLNPRIDDELKHETASLTHGAGVDAHARDDRRDQDPVDMPNPADRPDLPDVGGSGIPTFDADQRAEL